MALASAGSGVGAKLKRISGLGASVAGFILGLPSRWRVWGMLLATQYYAYVRIGSTFRDV